MRLAASDELQAPVRVRVTLLSSPLGVVVVFVVAVLRVVAVHVAVEESLLLAFRQRLQPATERVVLREERTVLRRERIHVILQAEHSFCRQNV